MFYGEAEEDEDYDPNRKDENIDRVIDNNIY